MTPAYKTDERVIKDIITRNTTCTNPQDKLDIIIYYKNPKVSNLFMKNNLSKNYNPLKQTNVIYKYSCPEEGCKLLNNVSYIGVTTTSLSRRLTMHAREGSIRKHMKQTHNKTLTRQDLVDNTKILRHCNNHKKLHIFEKVYISQHTPLINIQTDTLGTLLLYKDTIVQRNPPGIADLVAPSNIRSTPRSSSRHPSSVASSPRSSPRSSSRRRPR